MTPCRTVITYRRFGVLCAAIVRADQKQYAPLKMDAESSETQVINH
jgi:hypothetical protein